MPWSPLELPRLAGPQPTCPASPAPSHGNHSKALAQAPPPLPPDWPWGVPCGPHGIPCPLLWELPAKTIFPMAVVSWCPGPAVPHSFYEHTTFYTSLTLAAGEALLSSEGQVQGRSVNG